MFPQPGPDFRPESRQLRIGVGGRRCRGSTEHAGEPVAPGVSGAEAHSQHPAASIIEMRVMGKLARLRDAGVPNPQAESHAEAAREFIMTELVTKQNLLAVGQDLLAVRGPH